MINLIPTLALSVVLQGNERWSSDQGRREGGQEGQFALGPQDLRGLN